MFEKMKKVLPGIFTSVGFLTLIGASAEGSSNSGVLEAITTNVSSLKTDAVAVIGAAVTLAFVFWGAKLLIRNFKSMAK